MEHKVFFEKTQSFKIRTILVVFYRADVISRTKWSMYSKLFPANTVSITVNQWSKIISVTLGVYFTERFVEFGKKSLQISFDGNTAFLHGVF